MRPSVIGPTRTPALRCGLARVIARTARFALDEGCAYRDDQFAYCSMPRLPPAGSVGSRPLTGGRTSLTRPAGGSGVSRGAVRCDRSILPNEAIARTRVPVPEL